MVGRGRRWGGAIEAEAFETCGYNVCVDCKTVRTSKADSPALSFLALRGVCCVWGDFE